jgi:hypothetical protein
MAQHKALVLFKLNSHAKMASDRVLLQTLLLADFPYD